MAPHFFLETLGKKLRARRLQIGLSQKRVGEVSGLSPRFVSQLESGRGNISIARLYELTRALDIPLHELVRVEARSGVIALVGLRGAGKSTIGKRIATSRAVPFIELDALIEDEAGLGLSEIFALHGETYYRRLEREVLSRFLAEDGDAVLATGGSLVHERATYDVLKASATTIWLKARPEQHLARVAAQGDRRPMAGRADPLAELRALLHEREPLYAEAEIVVDTSTRAPGDVVREILRALDDRAA